MGFRCELPDHAGAMVKAGYEINDGLSGEATDEDRWIMQIAYGY